MKKTRFMEAQMVNILREVEKSPIWEAAEKHGISDVPIDARR